MLLPTLQECEEAVRSPATKWAGRCFEIAHKIVEAGLVSKERGLGGEAVYGHWIGPIAPNSFFAAKERFGFVQHGWIFVPEHDLVIDPTRFVFEAKSPYLFVGHEPIGEDHPWPYDEGGNRWRTAFQVKRPPQPESGDRRFELAIDAATADFVAALLGEAGADGRHATDDQIFWLANLPYQKIADGIGNHRVHELYEAIAQAESYFEAFLPVDNRRKAGREAKFPPRKRNIG